MCCVNVCAKGQHLARKNSHAGGCCNLIYINMLNSRPADGVPGFFKPRFVNGVVTTTKAPNSESRNCNYEKCNTISKDIGLCFIHIVVSSYNASVQRQGGRLRMFIYFILHIHLIDIKGTNISYCLIQKPRLLSTYWPRIRSDI